MCSHAGHRDLGILDVECNARGILNAGVGSFDRADRGDIAFVAGAKHEDRIIGIIGDEQLLAWLVHCDVRRPVERCLRTFDDPQRLHIPGGIQRINRNRRQLEFAVGLRGSPAAA